MIWQPWKTTYWPGLLSASHYSAPAVVRAVYAAEDTVRMLCTSSWLLCTQFLCRFSNGGAYIERCYRNHHRRCSCVEVAVSQATTTIPEYSRKREHVDRRCLTLSSVVSVACCHTTVQISAAK